MTTDFDDAISGIQEHTLNVLKEFIDPSQEVALLDFPNHQNAGDSLIWQGTRRYLKRLGVKVGYVADSSRYDPSLLRRKVCVGPVLIQGGGNLGDRWTHMQRFRERVIEDFPDRTIIQLPQSIDFGPGHALNRAQNIFSGHPDLTLLIRDRVGVERTKELFPTATVKFCPDLAFGNGSILQSGIRKPQSPRQDLVLLLRQDNEAKSHGFPIPEKASYLRAEWGLRGKAGLLWKVSHVPGAISKRIPGVAPLLYPAVAAAYEYQANLNVRTAREILLSGRVVVTDRLHATVLASLLQIPVVAMDNETGKVGAIYRDYLHKMPNVSFAGSSDEALALVERMSCP